jgi:hypothetical protein
VAAIEPTDQQLCVSDFSEVQFRTKDGTTIRLSHPILKAGLLCLGRCWPRALNFAELLDAGGGLLLEAGAPVPSEDDEGLLLESLYLLACSGEVSFLLSSPKLVRTTSDRPMASLLARKQSEGGLFVTNLLHQTVRLDDTAAAVMLRLLDGTRNFDELVAEIGRIEVLIEAHAADDRASSAAALKRFLAKAAKLGLLVA